MNNNDLGINMASVPQQRLPIELVTLISSFLVDTSSLRSLAQVNQVSHLVQQETISQLFSTTIYKCTPSWLHSVGFGIPKGWAHTRNLLLNDTTLALLQHHLGFLVHLKIIDKPCLSKVFPKLELLAVTDAQGFTRLTIHKPMSLAGIMERLDINTYMERSLYGTIWNRKAPTPLPRYFERSRLPTMETIIGIECQDGAYLLPADDSDDTGAGCYVHQKFPELRLYACGHAPEDREAVISGIVQFLKCYQRAQEHQPKADQTTLQLHISEEWLDLFVDAVEKMQTLLYRVAVRLTNRSSTFDSFKERFIRLAEVYAANWSPQSAETVQPAVQPLFVSLIGKAAPDPGSSDAPVRATVEAGSNGHAHGCGHVTYMAKLESGHLVNGNATVIPRGFTGYITRLAHTAAGPPQVRLLFHKAYACQEAYDASVDADSA